jgi:hypothetical protein
MTLLAGQEKLRNKTKEEDEIGGDNFKHPAGGTVAGHCFS